jgi:spheroidene monooxygenase
VSSLLDNRPFPSAAIGGRVAVMPPLPIVTLSLFRFARWRDRAWALGQMALARRPLTRTDGIGFFKLMGAGTGEGFTPLPDAVVAILATWPDLARARAALADAPVYRRFGARASERFDIHLETLSARGLWSRATPFAPAGRHPEPVTRLPAEPPAGPVAAITRATIRPRTLLKFWARVPAISARIGADPNVLFKAGVGEVPWLHQVTVSVWPDAAAMHAFARAGGPHADAIRTVRAEGWFAEELYARFAVRGHAGSWRGRDPLAGLDMARPAAAPHAAE